MDEDVDSVAVSSPGITKGSNGKKNRPLVTVNGEHLPNLSLDSGQLQRWRFINATANHHSFSHLWLGKLVSKKKVKKHFEYVYQEAPIYLVALDGITLKQKVEITAQRPLFLGPGNRADLLFQKKAGTYAFFKGVPAGYTVQGKNGKALTDLKIQHDEISANPYLLPELNPFPPGSQTLNLGGPSANYVNYRRNWLYLNADPTKGNIGTPSQISGVSLAPNLWLVPQTQKDGSTLLGVDFARDPENDPFGWQPIDFNDITAGALTPQMLFTIKVSKNVAKDSPPMPSNEHLASISPTGDMKHVPLYVRPIADDEILQSRTALFDLSGIDVLTRDKVTGKAQQQIRQFTLNGRQFDLNDSIGNTDAESLISKYPSLHASSNLHLQLVRTEAHGLWNNDCWTNPGYYLPTRLSHQPIPGNANPGPYYRYNGNLQPCSGDPKLSYKQVTGIPAVAVVNPNYQDGTNWRGIPGLPVATTAEEWVLINNSPTGHPFHIHINPFMVKEVGQASYEPFEGSKYCGQQSYCEQHPTNQACQPPTDTSTDDGGWGWVMRTIDPNPDPSSKPEDSCSMTVPEGPKFLRGSNTMSWVVNNFFDTIVIPPHGYVRFRYWMNVPQQNGDGSQIADNVNRYGSWVYHCHILRHEDRGMMMIVGTQPKQSK